MIPRTKEQLRLDAESAALIDQRVLAVGLGAAARGRGGLLCGTAAQLHALYPAQANWPASAMEMEALGLPELAARPGFAGVTVTRAARGELDPKTMRRMAIWEIRADVQPAVAAQAPPPAAVAASQLATRPLPTVATPPPHEATRPSAPVAGARSIELLRIVPSTIDAAAASDVAHRAAGQAANEHFERTGQSVTSICRTAAIQCAWQAFLASDRQTAEAAALSAARLAIHNHNDGRLPPRAA